MTRSLKPCTIIPRNLYVERAADRQLARIIDDMGRPGYVLVARQMGKTNLLLNAKRKAGFDDVFVYLDVSNSVPDVRSFFRAVVDLAVDNLPAGGEHLRAQILERRESGALYLEHKEHEAELRDILRSIGGRLIICIDEIDALTKVDYSDQVFSFIRSIYFSGRTNFSEFGRLTYVLSGVAEPSELIKNRAISPFNIGEKIYLEDFCEAEFSQFLSQARLDFAPAVAQRVFHWTNGNPRMSWDVCSALETATSPASPEMVDAVVARLYFESYDLPPIDHIRTLVQADKEVRGAIMAIHYGRSETISDAVKGRLYLSGVISSSSSGVSVVIKNRVIERAISEKWLSEIERSEQNALEYADSLYWAGRYADAIVAYEEYARTGGEVSDLDQYRFNRARCYYFVGRYEDAIAEFNGNQFPKSRSFDTYILSMSTLASAHLSVGNLTESVPLYERVIKELVGVEGYAPLDFHHARLNLSNAYLALDPPNVERAVELCENVVSALSPGEASEGQYADTLRCLAHYNLYRAAVKHPRVASAAEELDLAIASAQNSDRAALLLEKAKMASAKADRLTALSACVEHCAACKVQIAELRIVERPLSFNMATAAQLVYELAVSGDETLNLLKDFVSFCGDSSVGHDVDVYRVMLLAGRYAMSHGRDDVAVRLYLHGAGVQTSARTSERFFITSAALLVASEEALPELSKHFLDELESYGPHVGIPLAAAHRVVSMLINRGDSAEALKVMSKMGVDSFEGLDLTDMDSCVTAFNYLRAAGSSVSTVDLNSSVRKLYEAVGHARPAHSSFYLNGRSQKLASQIMSVFPSCFELKTIQRQGRKISRNDLVRVKYPSGEVLEGKYKKFQEDVQSGRAKIANEES